MSWLLILGGVFVLGIGFLDALWTTIAPLHAGPLTKWTARGWWRASLWVHRRRARGAHGLLTFAGPALLVVAFLEWVALLWAGWFLIFSAEPGAVVGATSGTPADFAGRLYYIGFVLFTLGTGDYVPVGGAWEVLSAVASLSGLFVVTLSITYLLSVVSAVTSKRQLASSIHSLGATPADLVRRAWDGSGFPGLGQHLASLGQALDHNTQRHLAYPVLHYFHSGERETALAPNFAVLAEALLLLDAAVAEEARPAPAVLRPARATVRSFLDTLEGSFISAAATPPPAPSAEPLAAGVPTGDPDALDRAVEAAARQRRLLLGLVLNAGWTWTDVTSHDRSA
jgi:hypothetical protein